MKKAGVYLISDGIDKVKIGLATDPVKRLKQLQTGHAGTLAIVDYDWLCEDAKEAYRREKELHRRYKHLHIKNEWFHWTPDVSLRGYVELNRLGARLGQLVAAKVFTERDGLEMAMEHSGGVRQLLSMFRPNLEAGAGRKLTEDEAKIPQTVFIKTMWTAGYQWGLNHHWNGKTNEEDNCA